MIAARRPHPDHLHAEAVRPALVPHACRRPSRPQARPLQRPIRRAAGRAARQPRALRPGTIPRPARLGSLFFGQRRRLADGELRRGSINGRMLGHDEPIQVKEGQRVLFHILNASATEPHWLALAGTSVPGDRARWRPVPNAGQGRCLRLGPAERISAIVTMNSPGVWVLGEAAPSFPRRRHGHGHRIRKSDRKAAGTAGNPNCNGTIACSATQRLQPTSQT